MHNKSDTPENSYKNRILIILIPTILIFVLFLVTYFWARQWEQNDSLSDFRLLSQQADGQVRYKFEEQESLLEQMEGLFSSEGGDSVTRLEFHQFVQKSLKRFPMIQALEWVPKIEQSQRSKFELSQKSTVTGFEIRERNAAKEMQRASNRAEYFPVTYVEPLAGNMPALGFDLASNDKRLEAISKSVKLGSTVITEPITLVQESQKQSGVLLISGVSGNGKNAGVVLTVLRMGDFMDKLLDSKRELIFTRLIDVDTKKSLYDNFGSNSEPPIFEHEFDFGSRHFRLETYPTPTYFSQHKRWQSLIILVAGFLVSTLVGALLLLITGSNVRINEQVSERTKQLKESEERWQFALEGSGDGVWDWNPKTDEAMFSKRWKGMIGYTESEFPNTGAAFFEHVHPDDVARVSSVIREYLSGITKLYMVEFRLRCKDNTWKWILARGKSVKDNIDGSLLRIIGTHTDITDRKQYELDIKRQSDKNKAILRNASDGIHILDDKGNLIEASDSFCAMLGYQRNELIGKNVTKWDAQMGAAELAKVISQNMASNQRSQFETRHRRKDGTVIEVEISSCPIEMDGGFVLFNSSRDVTERKTVANELVLAKEKADSANSAKSDFLANMSHEIRTPMNGVIGLSELALDSKDSAEIHNFLQQINDSSKSLLGILNDILDFSKIEARQLSIENAVFKLEDLLESLNRMFSLRAHDKGLIFLLNQGESANQLVYGDQLRIRQILINLLGNAIKFTATGEVSLSVRQTAASAAGVSLIFAVQDSGIGLTPEQIQGLFQPFVQADNSISRRFGGTGLGLSISLNLAKLMGGDIKVESRIGFGSTFSFYVTLPVARTTKHDNHKPATDLRTELIQALKGKRVLLTEDTRVNQVVASKMLAKIGVIVDIANNGQEAIECLEKSSYDVVLMDVQMPVMNGLEATRLIRLDSRFVNLPIIAMSAGVTLDEQEACNRAGMTGFVGKPINSAELTNKLVDVCFPHPSNDI